MLSRVAAMLGLVASLNIALFVFNLIPLLPLDGGHIVVALWEGIKRAWAKVFRRPPPEAGRRDEARSRHVRRRGAAHRHGRPAAARGHLQPGPALQLDFLLAVPTPGRAENFSGGCRFRSCPFAVGVQGSHRPKETNHEVRHHVHEPPRPRRRRSAGARAGGLRPHLPVVRRARRQSSRTRAPSCSRSRPRPRSSTASPVRSSSTARSPRPRRSSAASASSTCPTSTPRSRSRRPGRRSSCRASPIEIRPMVEDYSQFEA